jgi:hypothetical protein
MHALSTASVISSHCGVCTLITVVCRRIDEFVEDVGHAANVSAAVTTFALTLRRRSLARKFASGAHGGVAQHRASQTQMAVGRHVGHGADAASCTDSSDGVHDGVAAVVASVSAS